MAQGRTIGLLAFSGHRAGEPDEGLLEATQAIGSLFGQFLQRKQAEELLRDSEARFRSLTHLSSDFFWETDAEHRSTSIVHGPSYGAAQIGRGIIGKHPWGVASASPDQAGWAAHMAVLNSHLPFRDFEFARVMPDGGTRYFSVSGEPRFDATGVFVGYRGIGRDVTEIALARERIASLAYNDALTGLANRTSLGPALEQAIERTRRHRSKLAGVFIDLDGFKQVNDLHGHAAGDAFLVEVARRLRRSLRASDVVARLGGDEFFVVLEQMQDTAAVERVVSKLVGGDAAALRPLRRRQGARVGKPRREPVPGRRGRCRHPHGARRQGDVRSEARRQERLLHLLLGHERRPGLDPIVGQQSSLGITGRLRRRAAEPPPESSRQATWRS